MNEIERVVEVGKVALRQEGADLKSVAAALLTDTAYAPATQVKPPKDVDMTAGLAGALNDLPKVFGLTRVDEVRTLTEAEKALLGQEQDTIDKILKPLETRLGAIKDAVRNHMDLEAVKEGKVTPDTVVDAHGHYVVAAKDEPEQVRIPGTNKAWSREFRAGKVDIDGSALLDLYEAGEITREQYLAFTREVRVFDEQKAFAAMAKDPSLLNIFRKIIKKGRPSTALFVRKLK